MSSFNLTHPRWSYTTFIAELVLRVFHVWGQYCLHLAFSACLRTNGGDIQNRTEDERLQSSRFTIKLYRHQFTEERKRVRWAVSISRILDGVTQPWIRTTNRSARATELVLRVFHWWGRYCLHLTFNACLRTHGPRYRIRTGPICLEGRDASRWHQSRIWRFLSQPLYKYYITIFKKNQIFTFQLCHTKVNLTA